MAKRYSGDLKINVTYDDHNFYRVSVSRDGKSLWHGRVNPAPAGFGPGIAYDSPQAYDEVASSALAFADEEIGDVGDTAEYKEDLTGYLIRREPLAKTAKTANHATRKFDDSTIHRTKPKIVVRKVEGRWQPVTASGVIVRGNVYNADGLGYSTKQGAEEAAVMIRKLGKTA
jgi:hypothetical protein